MHFLKNKHPWDAGPPKHLSFMRALGHFWVGIKLCACVFEPFKTLKENRYRYVKRLIRSGSKFPGIIGFHGFLGFPKTLGFSGFYGFTKTLGFPEFSGFLVFSGFLGFPGFPRFLNFQNA